TTQLVANHNEGIGGGSAVRNLLWPSAFIGLVLAIVAAQAAGSDRIEQFQKARRSALPLLRGKTPGDRQEGLKKLEEFPIADSVKMIQPVLADENPEVRESAYQTLVRLVNYQEVGDTLLMSAKKAIQRRDGQGAAPLLAALLFSEVPSLAR